MSTVLVTLQEQRETALAKAESIISTAERARRQLSTTENSNYSAAMAEVNALNIRIKTIESLKTMRSEASRFAFTPEIGKERLMPKTLSADYLQAFHKEFLTPTSTITAALSEGSNTAGGYAVPSVVADDRIVPLAPQDSAVRRLAQVIETVSDIRVPAGITRGAAAIKSETSAASPVSTTLSQFTLSAFMEWVEQTASIEIAQDAKLFQAFVMGDAERAILELEESKFISGSGFGEAQGLIGNVGAGTTQEPDGLGNLVSISGTLDLLATLKETYHNGAAFLMQRATSIVLRKAQVQSGLYEPVFSRVGSQDYLHGYPVEYSSVMPTAVRGNTPILFGNFQAGYIIGDRGGSAVSAKVIDQDAALAFAGQIAILIYRRTDGRVRRSEAIQSYNIAAS